MVIIIPLDYEGDTLNLALLQYHFSKGEHQVTVAPHSNSRSGQPFVRTMPSVMSKLKAEVKHKTPKRALQFVYNQKGGILEANSAVLCHVVDSRPKTCEGPLPVAMIGILYMQSCICVKRVKEESMIRLSD